MKEKEKRKPLVSVIVPIYNAERYLHRCLDALLKQTYHKLEIILVDDGSTDTCGAICDDYVERDRRIRVIHQKNAGVSAARNAGVEVATGEWIVFCDADDYIPLDAYSRMLSVPDLNDVDVIVGKMKMITALGVHIFRYRASDQPFYKFFYGPSVCSRMFRGEIAKKLKFSNTKIGEDVIYLTDFFAQSDRIKSVNAITYVYCHNQVATESSLSNEYSLSALEAHVACWSYATQEWMRQNIPDWTMFCCRHILRYLFELNLKLPSIKEKIEGVVTLKNFLRSLNLKKNTPLLQSVINVPIDEFLRQDPEAYLNQLLSYTPEERTEIRFATGQLGLQTIIRFFISWLKYKLLKKVRGRA